MKESHGIRINSKIRENYFEVSNNCENNLIPSRFLRIKNIVARIRKQ